MDGLRRTTKRWRAPAAALNMFGPNTCHHCSTVDVTCSAKPILCDRRLRVDDHLQVAHLPRGSAKSSRTSPQIGDGMSATAACAVVRLGGRAAFLGAGRGDDANGHAAIKSLTEAGLDCSGVRLVRGSGLVLHRGGGRRRQRIVIPRHDPAMPNDASWLPLERIRAGEFAAVLTSARWPGGAAVLDAARSGHVRRFSTEVGAPGVPRGSWPGRNACAVQRNRARCPRRHRRRWWTTGAHAQTGAAARVRRCDAGAGRFYWLRDGKGWARRGRQGQCHWTRWAPAMCSGATR